MGRVKEILRGILDIFLFIGEMLITDPLFTLGLILVVLSPIFLIVGAVMFFMDAALWSVFIILGLVGVALAAWEIFF